MKYVATLRTDSKDALSVSKALDVDNIKLEGLRVGSEIEDGVIVTKIESNNLKTIDKYAG